MDRHCVAHALGLIQLQAGSKALWGSLRYEEEGQVKRESRPRSFGAQALGLIRMQVGSLCYLLMMFFTGCRAYSFSGSANPNIKTVAVPVFDDRTAEFGIKEQLTNAIVQAFTAENTLRIADRRVADSVLQGTLLRINEQAGVYTQADEVQEIRVYLVVQIKYEDAKKRKTIWEEQLTQFGVYSPRAAGSGDRQNAITEAVGKIATEVINKTVSGW